MEHIQRPCPNKNVRITSEFCIKVYLFNKVVSKTLLKFGLKF